MVTEPAGAFLQEGDPNREEHDAEQEICKGDVRVEEIGNVSFLWFWEEVGQSETVSQASHNEH